MMGPIKHCRMCLRTVSTVLTLSPSPIANAFTEAPDTFALRHPLGLSQCPGCGHVQISHHIDGAYLFYNYRYQTPEAERPRLEQYAAELATRYPNALRSGSNTQATADAPKVLEIGCNNGMFCDALWGAGFYAIGIDPVSTRWGGLPKWFNSKTARQVAQGIGQMKLIVSNNTLAHVDDLRNVLLGVKYLLAPDGHLVFEVQYLPKLVDGVLFDMIYHEHKDYHHLAPWPALLAKFGMCITDIEYLQTHGGSVRVHVGFGEKGVTLPAEPPIDWGAFVGAIDAEKRKLIRKLDETPGKIAAFGATAKACTLINQFGIAGRISYCVDETPEKQGLYIPGTAIQIVGPEVLKADPPAAILLTAWNYAHVLRPRFSCEVIVPFKQAA